MEAELVAELWGILRDARYLVTVGRLERVRWYQSLWALEIVGVSASAGGRSA